MGADCFSGVEIGMDGLARDFECPIACNLRLET